MANRKRLQNMQLPDNTISPIVYEGYSVDPQQENVGILANRIDKYEQNIKDATKQATALDIALGEIGSKLHESEQPWFDKYKDNIRSQINARIAIGDYQGAINVGTMLGGKVASDSELNAKVQYNADLEQYRKTILNRNDLTNDKKQWALHKFANYDYKNNVDASGKIIGGNKFDDSRNIAASFNPDNEWAIVDKFVSEYSGGGGGTTHDMKAGISTTTSNTFHTKSAERLRDFMKERLKNNPYLREQVEEDFQSDLYAIESRKNELKTLDANSQEAIRLQEEINEREKALTLGDTIVSNAEDYYKLKYVKSRYPEALAYNNRVNNSSESLMSTGGGSGGSSGGSIGNFFSNLFGGTNKAEVVEIKNTNNPRDAFNSGNAISSPGESGLN